MLGPIEETNCKQDVTNQLSNSLNMTKSPTVAVRLDLFRGGTRLK
jgi:hypothetical protein